MDTTARTRRRALLWGLVAVVAVSGVLISASMLGVRAASELPSRSATQLVDDIRTSRVDGLSGTVVSKAALGLPPLPELNQSVSSPWMRLFSGTNTVRIWYGGPHKQRVALLLPDGEVDMIHNGRDMWQWNSTTNEAVHSVLSAEHAVPGTPAVSPDSVAQRALAGFIVDTDLSTGDTRTVAGRDAYQLVLKPRDARSKVGEVRVAVDAEKRIPTSVQVFARGATDAPALDVSFTDIKFAVPDEVHFRLNAPAGVRIAEQPIGIGISPLKHLNGRAIGSGWTTVFYVHLPKSDDRILRAMLALLPEVSGDWGKGRLLDSRLVSALVTDDGHLYVGAVEPEVLYAAADSLH